MVYIDHIGKTKTGDFFDSLIIILLDGKCEIYLYCCFISALLMSVLIMIG